MPKKTFKDNTAHLDRFFTDPDTENKQQTETATERTQEPHDTDETHKPPARFYRLNLKLKTEYKEYLEQVSWEAHKSITQYLNDLIEADKATRNT